MLPEPHRVGEDAGQGCQPGRLGVRVVGSPDRPPSGQQVHGKVGVVPEKGDGGVAVVRGRGGERLPRRERVAAVGIQADRPLTQQDLSGLPLPERLWE